MTFESCMIEIIHECDDVALRYVQIVFTTRNLHGSNGAARLFDLYILHWMTCLSGEKMMI